MGEPDCICGCPAHAHSEVPPMNPQSYDERGQRTWCHDCACVDYSPQLADHHQVQDLS